MSLIYTHIQIYKISYEEKSLINSMAITANWWNTLKCLANIFPIRKWCEFINYLIFTPYEQKVNTCYHVIQVLRPPGNIYNFRTDWSMKYVSWYFASQIGHEIDIEGKSIFLIKQLSVELTIMNFYWKGFKRKLYKYLHFPQWAPGYQNQYHCKYFHSLLLKGHRLSVSKSKNIWKYLSILQALFFNRDWNRDCVVDTFSFRFSGSKFLINLRRQFRVRKFFSCM